MPIICIETGFEIGHVKELIIDYKIKAIKYLLIDNNYSEQNLLNLKIISTMDIIGIGEYAITIINSSVIEELGKNQEAINLIKNCRNNIMIELKVISKLGHYIGEVTDVIIDDENNCDIVGVEIFSNEKKEILSSDYIITIGKVIIVENSVLTGIINVKDDLKTIIEESKNIVKNKNDLFIFNNRETNKEKNMETNNIEIFKADNKNFVQDNKLSNLDEFDINSLIDEEIFERKSNQEITEYIFEEFKENSEDNDLDIFYQRQKQYLKGRKVTKTIYDEFGNILIDEGNIINDKQIDCIKSRGKLMELIMNNRNN